MFNTQNIFNIENYFKIALRRKWYIIIPFTVGIIISFGVYKHLPKEYRANTVILVRSPKVPDSFVRSTLTEPVTDRLSTISQEILSRTRLEKVIKEFNLYSDMVDKLHMEQIVNMMKTKIELKVQRQSGFSISFEGTDPKTVMMVTNKLASMFIEENLKSRESRVEGTAEFISRELKAIESNLKKKDDTVRRYKEKNMGQLPQQLEANLGILERLEQQFKTTSENLRAAEDRIVLFQNQIEQVMDRQSGTGSSSAALSARRSLTQREQGPENPLVAELNALKRDLANVESKYTEGHPDVVDLKRKIATLEPRMKKQEEVRGRRLREIRELQEDVAAGNLDPDTERLITQYQAQFKEAQLEAKRLKGEMGSLKEQMVLYQKRIEETPKREQEMVEINRDYELLKAHYQSLVDKKYQAQMSENLERKQQGEQFMVLDPAPLPEKPFKPNRDVLLAMGALLGFGIGLGLAWFRESMDRSFYEVSEVETYLKLPVVATILNLNEEEKKAA